MSTNVTPYPANYRESLGPGMISVARRLGLKTALPRHDQRGPHAVVAHPAHKVTQRRTARGGEQVAGVPQVVEVQMPDRPRWKSPDDSAHRVECNSSGSRARSTSQSRCWGQRRGRSGARSGHRTRSPRTPSQPAASPSPEHPLTQRAGQARSTGAFGDSSAATVLLR